LLPEQKQITMRKTVLTYGLLSGVVAFGLWYFTQFLTISPDGKIDMDKALIYGYATMIISLSMIFFGVRHYRDRYQGGLIKFGKAFWIGFRIALIAAILYMIGWMIYYNTSEVAQQHMVQYGEHMKQEMMESGMSADDLAKKTAQFEKNMEMYKNPFFMALMTIFEILPVGIIVSLISAFILKKKVVSSE
jgi:predicted Co/Zn/Cd cation transporter (cation efflux family)